MVSGGVFERRGAAAGGGSDVGEGAHRSAGGNAAAAGDWRGWRTELCAAAATGVGAGVFGRVYHGDCDWDHLFLRAGGDGGSDFGDNAANSFRGDGGGDCGADYWSDSTAKKTRVGRFWTWCGDWIGAGDDGAGAVRGVLCDDVVWVSFRGRCNMRDRDYLFYELTSSLCATCLRKVEAKVVIQDQNVYMLKRCPEHGFAKVLISTDAEYYKLSRQTIKPGQMPLKFNTPIRWGCPYDCGLCPDHEQHSCLTLVEITDQCNLTCPICYSESSPKRTTHRSLEQVEFMLDCVVRNEGEPDVVQISGGEPTIHPQFWQIMDAAKKRPIKHVMLNTNGLRIAHEEEFARRLKEYQPGFEIYLQFDSLRERPLRVLRGKDLIPVPCHPDCLTMAYASKIDGCVTPLTGLIDPQVLLHGEGNTIVYEKNPAVRGELLKVMCCAAENPQPPGSLKQLLCCLPMFAGTGSITYDNIFRIIIMQFLDAHNFDVRAVKKTCVHIVHRDGRIIPFDTFNMFYRDEKEKRLEELREETVTQVRVRRREMIAET